MQVRLNLCAQGILKISDFVKVGVRLLFHIIQAIHCTFPLIRLLNFVNGFGNQSLVNCALILRQVNSVIFSNRVRQKRRPFLTLGRRQNEIFLNCVLDCTFSTRLHNIGYAPIIVFLIETLLVLRSRTENRRVEQGNLHCHIVNGIVCKRTRFHAHNGNFGNQSTDCTRTLTVILQQVRFVAHTVAETELTQKFNNGVTCNCTRAVIDLIRAVGACIVGANNNRVAWCNLKQLLQALIAVALDNVSFNRYYVNAAFGNVINIGYVLTD